jgi:CheY-like chemotaxis protein
MEAGVLRVVVENFGLRQVISECATIASGAAASKRLVWTATVAPEVPDGLRGDRSRLRQVLVNLVANAIKFTETGGVTLRVEREGSEGLRFSVEDTGCGIPEAAHGRIFAQFGQVDGTTTRKQRGFGLGLSISKYLVERMGGEIGFVSHENVGSTFWFTLQLQLADSVAPPEVAGDAPAKFYGARVLVAEDNAINQRLAKRMLERLGFEVEVATDGSEAVAKARDASFDLILMDLQMPEMDGLEAARRIRREERDGRRTPIVAFSANANESDVVTALAAGMDDHLSKPVDLARLDSILRRCLKPPLARI